MKQLMHVSRAALMSLLLALGACSGTENTRALWHISGVQSDVITIAYGAPLLVQNNLRHCTQVRIQERSYVASTVRMLKPGETLSARVRWSNTDDSVFVLATVFQTSDGKCTANHLGAFQERVYFIHGQAQPVVISYFREAGRY